MKNRLILLVLVGLAVLGAILFLFFRPVSLPPQPPPDIGYLKAPDGFKIGVFAEELVGPRVIAFDPKGRMLVSETKAGRVTMLLDENGDGKTDQKKTVLENLESPHGLAFYTDSKSGTTYLYVAQIKEVRRYEYDIGRGVIGDSSGQNIANMPGGGTHFTRTIAFGPNYQTQPITQGVAEETMSPVKLYISVGSSCDVCIEDSWKRAAILESDPDGSYTAELAAGLRNSVFFAFHPETGEMWATEMGRDNLGDNLPPDEINIIKPKKEYGWPFCYGSQVKDAAFRYGKINRTDITDDCSKTEGPAIEIPAHSAPLGLAFIPPAGGSSKWPEDWQNDLLVAYHGSSRSYVLRGYKIVRFQVDGEGNVSSQEDFISGWLDGDKILGRPVDLKFGPDSALYISDDTAGAIYRVMPP